MPRAVNAHAYVNATFSMPVDSGNGFTVTAAPSIVFGGIDTHAVSGNVASLNEMGNKKEVGNFHYLEGA